MERSGTWSFQDQGKKFLLTWTKELEKSNCLICISETRWTGIEKGRSFQVKPDLKKKQRFGTEIQAISTTHKVRDVARETPNFSRRFPSLQIILLYFPLIFVKHGGSKINVGRKLEPRIVGNVPNVEHFVVWNTLCGTTWGKLGRCFFPGSKANECVRVEDQRNLNIARPRESRNVSNFPAKKVFCLLFFRLRSWSGNAGKVWNSAEC